MIGIISAPWKGRFEEAALPHSDATRQYCNRGWRSACLILSWSRQVGVKVEPPGEDGAGVTSQEG